MAIEYILAREAPETDFPGNGLVVTIIWVLAVCLGIYEYGRTKGRVGHALTVTLGGGLLATFVAYPQVLMETVPAVFVAIIDWAAGQVT